ncbi:MAG: hypothetical protein B5766_02125 [Candidatus Lumbricidophila eiseniae]|uniref:Carbohydrate kinase PfkB domain-containing protein n=1 Tax=Candidatus Lumbricidiphila eiseniae TaxID=1969409 RepID=A0A2A6FSV3_9MICO|nr:MAG: hypothetical protein B5766_02125 [Candidatus Lumbricidophila eiseniae]
MGECGRVVSLGSILIDLAVDVPALPHRGGDMLATGTRTEVGGGFNLVAAVARQNIECVYAGLHGTGRYGDMVRCALAAEKITPALLPRDGEDTGFCVALVEPDAERTFITVPGAEAKLTAGDLTSLTLRATDIVALSGYDLVYPVSGAALVDWTQWLGLRPAAERPRIVLDPGPLVSEIEENILGRVLRVVDILTINQREARLLAKLSKATGADLVEAVRRHPAIVPSVAVIVREGHHGCVAAGGVVGDEVIAVGAPQVIAVDTTGAGDAHTGVLLAELARGSSIDSALRTANRAAAISVTRPGSATAPHRDELLTSALC